jgi:hypothetical protein
MQDTLFAVFLFMAYFCFACSLLHKSTKTMPSKKSTQSPGQLSLFNTENLGCNTSDTTVSNPVTLCETVEDNSSDSTSHSTVSEALGHDEVVSFTAVEAPNSVDANNLWETEPTPGDAQAQEVEEELQPIPTPSVSEDSEMETLLEATQDDFHNQVLAAINELGKREARRLCGPLKIQQKRNGIELSTELMVAAIRKKFKTDPDRVIAVICDRLPRLLTTLEQESIAQQQLQEQAS